MVVLIGFEINLSINTLKTISENAQAKAANKAVNK
jgi:hypothetical protein